MSDKYLSDIIRQYRGKVPELEIKKIIDDVFLNVPPELDPTQKGDYCLDMIAAKLYQYTRKNAMHTL